MFKIVFFPLEEIRPYLCWQPPRPISSHADWIMLLPQECGSNSGWSHIGRILWILWENLLLLICSDLCENKLLCFPMPFLWDLSKKVSKINEWLLLPSWILWLFLPASLLVWKVSPKSPRPVPWHYSYFCRISFPKVSRSHEMRWVFTFPSYCWASVQTSPQWQCCRSSSNCPPQLICSNVTLFSPHINIWL